MRRFFNTFLVILAASLTLVFQTSSFAQPVEMSNTVVRGMVRTASGQPLVGARLFLFDLPLSQYWPELKEQAEVTTDAKGNFAWRVPKDLEHQVLANINLTSSPPSCYALPLEPGSSAKVQLSPGSTSTSATRDVLERLVLSCKTQWLQGDKTFLSVIAPDRGRVELLLHEPGGKPLKNRLVNVIVANQFSNYAGALVFEGKTDNEGHLFWQGYSDVRRLSIMVPGVGFGSTGQFALLPDQVVSPRVPALASFAKVSGSVVPALLKAGASVHIEDFFESERKWYDPQAAVDEQGQFSLDGVPPGEHTLVLKNGQGVAKKVTVIVGAAEHKSSIVFESADPAPVVPSTPRSSPLPTPRRFGVGNTTVSGRVTNVAGEAVSNVSVYAICSFDGGLRQYQEILSTESLPDGSYTISGLQGSRVALVAANGDGPLALGSAEGPSDPDATSKAPELHADLVLPSGHTELTVQVLRDGNPLAGAWVRLSPQSGTGLFSANYMGTMRSPARDSLQALLTPKAMTNSAGLVKFKDLTPGAWNIAALAGGESELEDVGQWMGGRSLKADYAVTSGITVRSGESKTFALSVYSQPGEIAYHIESPEGLAPKDPSISLSFGLASSSSGSNTAATVDKKGDGVYSMSHSGLWSITTRFAATSMGNNAEPFYQAGALIAVSPALGQQPPIFLPSIKRSAGSIRVQVKDAAGLTTGGSAWIGDGFDSAKFGASSTAKAAAIFSDMPSGSYLLDAAIKSLSLPPSLGEKNEPFPNDKALSGIQQFVPQNVEVKADKESLAVMKPQLLGYVRGKIQVSDTFANYAVYLPYGNPSSVQVRYNAQSGEFVAGPFATPNATIRVVSIKGKAGDPEFRQQDFPVHIVPGKVVHLNPAPEIALSQREGSQTDTLLTMGGVLNSSRDALSQVSVLLSDGKTPAWGAQVAVFTPKIWSPVLQGKANAIGLVSRIDSWYTDDTPTNPPSGSPTEPVMVAWLPGANGATIVPLPTGSNGPIILPVPASISGHINVDQKPVRGLNSSFTILAAYRGQGKLNSVLSVEAAADANGDFELSGLTPGDYVVQAARDGIWLSSSQRLTVGNQPLPKMNFDIPAPGTPLILHLQDSKGQALVERQVDFMRPVGPQADRLWPQSAMTDAKGDLYLNGLEAGKHTFQVESTDLNAKPAPQTGSPSKSKDAAALKTTFAVTVKPLVPGSSLERKPFVVERPFI